MKKPREKYKFKAGILLLGPMLKGKRKIIESSVLPLYQLYAEEASKIYETFYNLYDPYAESAVINNDYDAFINDIDRVVLHYSEIIEELNKIRSIVEKGKDIKNSIIMVTPYVGSMFDVNDSERFIDIE